MSLPSLRLKANADRRLRAGHLWVYSNEIDVAATPLHGFKAGDQAVLEGAGGEVIEVTGAPLRYAAREGYLNPSFLALPKGVDWRARLLGLAQHA